MIYPTVRQVIILYEHVTLASGGAIGIRDFGALESAVAQPRATFDHRPLYPALADAVAALGYSLIQNHPFVDGNKRIGHASMELALRLNGHEIVADADEQYRLIIGVASGSIDRSELAAWLGTHIRPLPAT